MALQCQVQVFQEKMSAIFQYCFARWKVKSKIGLIIFTVTLIAILFEIYKDYTTYDTTLLMGTFQPKCDKGKFLLPGMNSCHPWLTCSDIKSDLNISDTVIGLGTQKIGSIHFKNNFLLSLLCRKIFFSNKLIKEGIWQGHSVAVNILDLKNYFDDLMYGLEMLQFLNPHPKVVQLVGWCIDNKSYSVILTEKHSLGSANYFNLVLKNRLPQHNNLPVRFGLCIDFVHILHILHSQPGGPFVMCDTNYPEKTLSQFLLTDNLTLVLNDVDAVPQVRRQEGVLIKCGESELTGDYIAPEQLWPFENLPFMDKMMPPYDEKVDIWKIPDICNVFIRDVDGAGALKLHLFNIHSQCREFNPLKRPTAEKVLIAYEKIKGKLKL